MSGIQFTTHFIEILGVETCRFVGSFVNVILMCGQSSSRAAESKRRALGNYFPERFSPQNLSRAGSTFNPTPKMVRGHFLFFQGTKLAKLCGSLTGGRAFLYEHLGMK